ncbi:hypothetical protein FRB94_008495 [Tulasnella sp. JGI-2019a]|nr:hypothetical protein FRB94_008495 [Tulasnella sp. JGI-2019a]
MLCQNELSIDCTIRSPDAKSINIRWRNMFEIPRDEVEWHWCVSQSPGALILCSVPVTFPKTSFGGCPILAG